MTVKEIIRRIQSWGRTRAFIGYLRDCKKKKKKKKKKKN